MPSTIPLYIAPHNLLPLLPSVSLHSDNVTCPECIQTPGTSSPRYSHVLCKPSLCHTLWQLKFGSSFNLWPSGECNATNSPERACFLLFAYKWKNKIHIHIYIYIYSHRYLYEVESSSGVKPRGDGLWSQDAETSQ